MVTTDARDSAGLPPTTMMQPAGISLLDPEEDEIARGLTPVRGSPRARGPGDAGRPDHRGHRGQPRGGRALGLARIREQPAYAQLSERAREPGEPRARAALDRAVLDQLQTRLDEQVKEHFPDGGVQRVALLQHGDDPAVEPGDLLARVYIEEAEEDPPLPAWHRDHETMIGELQHELAEQLPAPATSSSGSARTAAKAKSGPVGPARRPARSKQDLTPAHIRLGPAELQMLDALITTGTAASRGEPSAGSWPGSANGPPTPGSANGHENWTSSKPTSDTAGPGGRCSGRLYHRRDMRESQLKAA